MPDLNSSAFCLYAIAYLPTPINPALGRGGSGEVADTDEAYYTCARYGLRWVRYRQGDMRTHLWVLDLTDDKNGGYLLGLLEPYVRYIKPVKNGWHIKVRTPCGSTHTDHVYRGDTIAHACAEALYNLPHQQRPALPE